MVSFGQNDYQSNSGQHIFPFLRNRNNKEKTRRKRSRMRKVVSFRLLRKLFSVTLFHLFVFFQFKTKALIVEFKHITDMSKKSSR